MAGHIVHETVHAVNSLDYFSEEHLAWERALQVVGNFPATQRGGFYGPNSAYLSSYPAGFSCLTHKKHL